MDYQTIFRKLSVSKAYMDTGSGELARRWNCSPDVVRSAKKSVILNNKLQKMNSSESAKRVLILDIETAPMKAFVWRRWKQNVYLDQTISEWFMISWAAKWLYSVKTMSGVLTSEEAICEDDSRITSDLWVLINSADIVVAHNGNSFDLPKINTRFILNGCLPPKPYFSIDTKVIASKQFGFSSNKLDALAGYFNIEHKDDTDFDLWKNCLDGDSEALAYMAKYNIKDVDILEEVYLRLRPWVKNHPNVSIFNNTVTEQCSYCGSDRVSEIHGKLYYTSVGGYKMYRCKDCGGISRGRKTVIEKSRSKTTLVSVGK